MKTLAMLVVLASAGAAHAAAPAGTIGGQSFPTDLNLDDCSIVKTNDLETTWACPGYKGIPVEVTKGNLHFKVSYGLTSTAEKAAAQSIPPANTLSPSITWRLSNRAGRWQPFAAITRYLIEPEGEQKRGEVLAVTRLGEGNTCQIAYIDALANPDAEALAEQAADAHGLDFDCKKDQPVKVGKFSAW